MVKNVVNSIVVEPKQKRGRKPKNAAALENKVLEEPLTMLEKDNNIILMSLIVELVVPSSEVLVNYNGDKSIYLLSAYDHLGNKINNDIKN